MLGRVLLIIAIILLVVMVVLYFLGKKAQKKKEEQDAQVAAAAQSVSMLIIDKKRMRLKDAGLPRARFTTDMLLPTTMDEPLPETSATTFQEPWASQLTRMPSVV